MKPLLVYLAISASLVTVAKGEPNTTLQITTQQREALGIAVGKVDERELVPRPRLPGRITLPNARTRLITARSSGVLVSPSVAVGDRVELGQDLARLESSTFVSLQREYLEALSQRDLSRSTAQREEQLAEEGVIAGRRASQSSAALREMRALLDERKQALMLSGMSDEQFAELTHKRRLDPNLVLRSTLSGVILEQYVQSGERLAIGDAVYRIGDLDTLTVETHTPLDIAHALEPGTPFVLPDEGASGRVIAIGSEVHSLDQGLLVRGTIEAGSGRLRPGQFVRVQFETPREQASAFAIPAKAVVHVESQAWVFRQVESGFEPVPVEVIGGSGQERVVIGPLDQETRLAIRGTAALKSHWLDQGGPG